jgi:hypothetical protein
LRGFKLGVQTHRGRPHTLAFAAAAAARSPLRSAISGAAPITAAVLPPSSRTWPGLAQRTAGFDPHPRRPRGRASSPGQSRQGHPRGRRNEPVLRRQDRVAHGCLQNLERGVQRSFVACHIMRATAIIQHVDATVAPTPTPCSTTGAGGAAGARLPQRRAQELQDRGRGPAVPGPAPACSCRQRRNSRNSRGPQRAAAGGGRGGAGRRSSPNSNRRRRLGQHGRRERLAGGACRRPGWRLGRRLGRRLWWHPNRRPGRRRGRRQRGGTRGRRGRGRCSR